MATARYGSYCMGAMIYLAMGFVLYFGLRLRNKLQVLRKANTTGNFFLCFHARGSTERYTQAGRRRWQ